MKDHDYLILAMAILLSITLGVVAGHGVATANKDTEIMDLQVQLETANASLAEVNVELAFWQDTMNRLANGEQFKGVDIKHGRPSTGN